MWHHNGLGRRDKTIWRQCVTFDWFTSVASKLEANVTHPLAWVSEGSTVAVFGCGCVGLSCVNAANLVGASRVIAVDVNSAKEEWARKFGATDFINPSQLPDGKRIQDHLVELTDGGLDFTFDATGNVSSCQMAPQTYNRQLCVVLQVDVMRAALEACHKGWGVSTIIGVAAAGKEISTRP